MHNQHAVRLAGLLVVSWLVAPLALAATLDGLDRVAASAMGRFTGGYGDDLALLVEPPEASDADYTLIILADAAGRGGSLGEIARFDNAAWGGVGDIYGNRPSVAFTQAGSLQLRSGNDAIGRNRWSETVTLVWRENTVLMAGYTYQERDTLVENSETRCDINLLTGASEVFDSQGTRRPNVGSRSLPFQQWIDEGRPNLCETR
ncbi:MAG: hypothetical protein AAF940_10005 [Pseudomonadota bacterium]